MTRLLHRQPGTSLLIALGQVCFLLMMGVCIAIEPSRVAIKEGLSFYGNQARTIVPFVLGFVLCVGLTLLALKRFWSIATPSARTLRRALLLLVAVMALVPLTPDSVDRIFDYTHMGVSAVLFCFALALGGWLALVVVRCFTACCTWFVQWSAGCLALCAQLGLHDYMIPSQLAFQLALWLLVSRTVRRLGAAGPQ
jgi:hypothetical protein